MASDGLKQLADAVGRMHGQLATAFAGFGAALARASEQQSLRHAIRAVCPPDALDAAFKEASERGWSLEVLYAQLASGWLPPAVD
jgi:hypothetical protein